MKQRYFRESEVFHGSRGTSENKGTPENQRYTREPKVLQRTNGWKPKINRKTMQCREPEISQEPGVLHGNQRELRLRIR